MNRRGELPTALAASALLIFALPAAGQEHRDDGRNQVLADARAAAAAGDFETAYARFVDAWEPSRDDPAVLASMAGAASRIGALADLRDRLQPVVASDPAAQHAARFWAAAALQSDVPVDSVRATLARRVEARPADVDALAGYVRVWIGHGGFDLAEALLDRAQEAGAPGPAVALLRGEVLEAAGDPIGALEAYVGAVVAEETDPGSGLRRARALLADWPDGKVPRDAVRVVEEARRSADASLASALAALGVRAAIAAGAWDAALDAARDPALRTSERAAALRAVATGARKRGAPREAVEAAEALIGLGASFARPEDRRLAEPLAELPPAAVDRRPQPEDEPPSAHEAPGGDPVARAEAALRRGDREALAAALEAASARGVDPSALAVPRGDLWLARGRPDSAMASWRRGIEAGTSRRPGLESLRRVRLLRALRIEGAGPDALAAVGDALLDAAAAPGEGADRLRDLAGRVQARDSSGVAAAILAGLAAEWDGRAGDPAGASRALERTARATPAEAPALLLAAGRWAARAEESERARSLWREVALDHPATPYALEARRLLADAEGR